MSINFELYKVFFYAAKKLNFSEAAKDLFISQSAVSQSIKKLEKQIDINLFQRHGKKISLTQEGKTLFKYIEKAVHLINSGEKELSNLKTLKKGEISIGASDTISKNYLLPFIQKFYKKYPSIKIHLLNNPSPTNVELVKDGIVDFGMINIDPKYEYSDITLNSYWKTENIFVCSKSYDSLLTQQISLKKLSNFPLLSLEETSTTRKVFSQYLKNQPFNLSFDFEVGTTSLILDMAVADLGIAYISKREAQRYLKEKKLFEIHIKERLPHIQVGLITNKKFPQSFASKKLLSMIREELTDNL